LGFYTVKDVNCANFSFSKNHLENDMNWLAIEFASSYYVSTTMHRSRFGFFGNDFHLPCADNRPLLLFWIILAPNRGVQEMSKKINEIRMAG
jgi:hypothetical protein